jgi:hypothetical protein
MFRHLACNLRRTTAFLLLLVPGAAAGPLFPPFDLYEAGPLSDETLAQARENLGDWLVVQQERRDARTWILLALPDGEVGGELPGWGRPRYLGRVRSGERAVYAAPAEAPQRLRTGRPVTVSPAGGTVFVTREHPAALARRAPHSFRVLERSFPLAAPREAGPPARFRESLARARRPGTRTAADVIDLIGQVSADSLREYVRALSETDLGNPTSRYFARTETEVVAKAYIEGKLEEALGPGTVSNHAFEMEETPGGDLIPVHNVIGRLESSLEGAGAIFVTAHYDAIANRSDPLDLCAVGRDPSVDCDCGADPDSVRSDPSCVWDWRTEPAPGADDNASGVAALIEAARLLGPLDFDFDLYFVALQGEELGLIGSAAFADSLAEADQEVFAVLNLDMIADSRSEKKVDIVANEGSEWIADFLLETRDVFFDQAGLTTTKFVEFFGRSDHASFWAAGMDAVLFIEDKNVVYPQYHKFQDTWAAIDSTRSRDQFELCTELAIAAIGRFALHHEAPDLAIPLREIAVEPQAGAELRTGSPATITARIFNYGTSFLAFDGDTTETLTARVSFYDGDPDDGGTLLGRETRTTVFPAGGFIEFEQQWNPVVGEEGFHDLHVTVEGRDAGYTQSELSSANNREVARVFVGGETPQVLLHYPFPNPQEGPFADLRLCYQLTSPAEVRISVYDLEGQEMGQFRADGSGVADGDRTGVNTITGRQFRNPDNRQVRVDSGIYVYVIRVLDRGGSLTHTATGKFAVVK